MWPGVIKCWVPIVRHILIWMDRLYEYSWNVRHCSSVFGINIVCKYFVFIRFENMTLTKKEGCCYRHADLWVYVVCGIVILFIRLLDIFICNYHVERLLKLSSISLIYWLTYNHHNHRNSWQDSQKYCHHNWNKIIVWKSNF